jgi:hypothetical protein
VQTTTNTLITEKLLNKPQNEAEAYYISDFDRLTKQIYYCGEYWQLYIKNGMIIKIQGLKER